jgi:hypothetical protein
MKRIWAICLLISAMLALLWDILLACVLVFFKVPHMFVYLFLSFSIIVPACFLVLAMCAAGSDASYG